MKPTIRRVGDQWEFVADNLLIRLPDREQVLALAWEHVLETTTPAPVAGASSPDEQGHHVDPSDCAVRSP